MEYKTEQEKFWSGEFGNLYIDRNSSPNYLSSNIALFSKIISHTKGIRSVIEYGSNIGMNLKALRKLIPEVCCTAVEINNMAVDILKQDEDLAGIDVYEESILEFQTSSLFDMSLIKGVLIHINPDELEIAYQKLYDTSARYICIVEYYNPTPVTIDYRGYNDKLFKRDFAGELIDKYKDVSLVDYGFVYHRDYNFPQDDVTWFLLEKRNMTR